MVFQNVITAVGDAVCCDLGADSGLWHYRITLLCNGHGKRSGAGSLPKISELFRWLFLQLQLCLLLDPGGAFAVSKASQLNRMEAIFVENEMLADGKVAPPETELLFESRKDLSSITSYLIETHGLEALEVWFDDSTLVSLDTFETNYQSRKLVKLMGFDFVSRYSGQMEKDYFELSTKDNMAYKLEGYDYLINLNYGTFNFWEQREFITIDNYQVKLQVKKEIAVVQLISLSMQDSSEYVSEVKMNNDLAKLIEQYDEDDVEVADFTFDISTDAIEARLYLRSVTGWNYEDSISLSSITGNVLLRKK